MNNQWIWANQLAGYELVLESAAISMVKFVLTSEKLDVLSGVLDSPWNKPIKPCGGVLKWWYLSWMVYFMENPIKEMDDLGASPL